MEKNCAYCGKIIQGRRPDAIYCSRRCSGIVRGKRLRDKDRDKTRRQWREYHFSEKGTITAFLNYARDRARMYNVPFELDREFIAEKLAGGICEVSGLPVQRISPGGYKTHPFAPSFDRINPSLGYVKSNVRLVIFAVNRAISDWGDDVLLTIARAIVKKHGP